MKRLINFATPVIPDDIGEVHLEWEFPDNVKPETGRWWYIVVSLLLGGLIIYSVLTSNFLFAIILVLGVFIFISQFFQTPTEVQVKIAEDGIIVDEKFYSYKVLKSFWFAYDPPVVKLLYLDFKNSLRKSLPIPLDEMSPLKTREVLLEYLEENLEKDEEEMDEILFRALRMR